MVHGTKIYEMQRITKLLDGNGVYLFKTNKGWYRAYRQSQKVWHCVCIVPSGKTRYTNNEGLTVIGNASSLVSKVATQFEVYEKHGLPNEMAYRKALMSIVATGSIDSSFEYKTLEEGEGL